MVRKCGSMVKSAVPGIPLPLGHPSAQFDLFTHEDSVLVAFDSSLAFDSALAAQQINRCWLDFCENATN